MEEAKKACNSPLMHLLESFKNQSTPEDMKENNIPEVTNDIEMKNQHLQNSVNELSERVNFLESLLTEVSKIGDSLKSYSMNSFEEENPVAIKELGEKLSAMKPMIDN